MKRLLNSGTRKVPRDRASIEFLKQLQADNYKVDNLVGVSPAEFQSRIEAFSSMDDWGMEGYAQPEMQRVRSIKFEWSESQDFGSFQVTGIREHRSKGLLSRFIDELGALEMDLSGKRVLDIGCWTGATSFLLAAMGADVVAIEEVTKYADCVKYMRDAFGVEKLDVRNLSLFDLTADEFQDSFDVVLFAGVLYHLSDPIIGTRITFNVLKPGGLCLLETSASKQSRYELEYSVGANRSNWFIPSRLTVERIMADVGFEDISSVVMERPDQARNRVLAVGKKDRQKDMTRAGLSVRSIR